MPGANWGCIFWKTVYQNEACRKLATFNATTSGHFIFRLTPVFGSLPHGSSAAISWNNRVSHTC